MIQAQQSAAAGALPDQGLGKLTAAEVRSDVLMPHVALPTQEALHICAQLVIYAGAMVSSSTVHLQASRAVLCSNV
jgi:hypothetical protein